jgi:hypothetical protein
MGGGQVLVPGAVFCTLLGLLRQPAWILSALQARGNCLISPHFLQTPQFFWSISQ